MSTEGCPEFFKLDHYLETIKQLCSADEVMNGLQMFDLLPSYYREGNHPEILELKNEILGKIVLPTDYARHDLEVFETAEKYEKQMSDARANIFKIDPFFNDMGDMIDDLFCFPRANMLVKVVKELNSKNIIPHIIELGPATYWVPHGLKKKGLEFKYKPVTLHRVSESSHKRQFPELFEEDLSKSNYFIFICFEVIEHMRNDQDLFVEYYKQKIDADVIMVSTPLNTYNGGDDKKEEFQHLRCYNSKDLRDFCLNGFPSRIWAQVLAPSQVIIGAKDASLIELIKND